VLEVRDRSEAGTESDRQPASSLRMIEANGIHGIADPMFPIEHGEALAEERT
jgi:hypothetical protein